MLTDAQSFPLPVPSLGYRVSGKEVEVPAPSAGWLLQSPVNPKPCGTFSWPTSKSPLSPFSMAAKSLLLPKPRGKRKHSKTTWSFSPLQNHMDLYLSTCFRASWFSHLLQSRMVYSFLPQNLVFLPLSLQNRMVLSLLHQSCLILSLLLQNLVVLSFSSSEPRGPLSIYFRTTWPSSFPLRTSWFSPSMAARPRFKSQCPSSFAAPFPTPPSQLHLPASPYSSSFTGLP